MSEGAPVVYLCSKCGRDIRGDDDYVIYEYRATLTHMQCCDGADGEPA